ncbi:MAG: hypothetical protein HY331_00180 [Chloroflexi bacterium]|nr:hypothetical protein [Chloroflexota bacterium]
MPDALWAVVLAAAALPLLLVLSLRRTTQSRALEGLPKLPGERVLFEGFGGRLEMRLPAERSFRPWLLIRVTGDRLILAQRLPLIDRYLPECIVDLSHRDPLGGPQGLAWRASPTAPLYVRARRKDIRHEGDTLLIDPIPWPGVPRALSLTLRLKTPHAEAVLAAIRDVATENGPTPLQPPGD